MMNLLSKWAPRAMIMVICLTGVNAEAYVEEDALKVISDFANQICADVPIKGSEDSLRLSGEAQAELSSLIKTLADIGVEGAIEYENSSYEGLLQEDIVQALSDSITCKARIWDDLKSTIGIEESVSKIATQDGEFSERSKQIKRFNDYCERSVEDENLYFNLKCSENLCSTNFINRSSGAKLKSLSYDIEELILAQKKYNPNTNRGPIHYVRVECKLGKCISSETFDGEKDVWVDYGVRFSDENCADEFIEILKLD